jgi:hypothetical protein
LGSFFLTGESFVRQSCRFGLTLAVLFLLPLIGCATFGSPPDTARPSSVLPDTPLILVADGAGDFRAASLAVRRVNVEEHCPLEVRTFVWSHGYLRILADQLDSHHVRREGQQLASLVMAQHRLCPERPISLVGHSAGCAVIVAAAECLPPGSLDHIILLAPSLPVDYDLRPALACAQKGIDVFYSERDVGYLRVGVLLAGLCQGRLAVPAGSRGFQPVVHSVEDAAYYAKLRQYPWEPDLAWTGHHGGHYGCYQRVFLQVFVLPVLTGAPAQGPHS